MSRMDKPMTDEEIDDMPAGSEMNRLVGEKVLGWEPVNFIVAYDNGKADLSHDIEAAWQVVEKLKKRGSCNVMAWSNEMYECYAPGVLAVADTAPLAICRAALKAVKA